MQQTICSTGVLRREKIGIVKEGILGEIEFEIGLKLVLFGTAGMILKALLGERQHEEMDDNRNNLTKRIRASGLCGLVGDRIRRAIGLTRVRRLWTGVQ